MNKLLLLCVCVLLAAPASAQSSGTATTVKPASTDQVRYVANSGNDSNDGLSWGTAKLTIAAACASLPNQDATCLLYYGTGVLYISPNFSGSFPAGVLSGQATALDIIGPGYLQGDSTVSSARGVVVVWGNEGYIGLFSGGFEDFIQAGPRGKECVVTATSVTSNILTVTCVNTFAASEVVMLSSTAESFLNLQKVTVATATGSSFTVNPFFHANYTNNIDFGNGTEKDLLATSTLGLPDLTGGTATQNSGVLLGTTATIESGAAGNCASYNGPTAATGLSGLMLNSGITCGGGEIGLPTFGSFIVWHAGASQGVLTSSVTTGGRTWTMPDATGTVPVSTNLLISTTAPTIAGAGCGGTLATIPANNGTAAFTVNVGTAPTSGGCTITLPAASTDWVCTCQDRTTITTAVDECKQSNSAASTTSAVLQGFSDIAGAAAFVANDILRVSCVAY